MRRELPNTDRNAPTPHQLSLPSREKINRACLLFRQVEEAERTLDSRKDKLNKFVPELTHSETVEYLRRTKR